jgi:hypothetical protein
MSALERRYALNLGTQLVLNSRVLYRFRPLGHTYPWDLSSNSGQPAGILCVRVWVVILNHTKLAKSGDN